MNAGVTAFLLRFYQDFKWSFEHLPVTLETRPSERSILRKNLKNPAPVIFDVGANLGASIAFYRSLFPSARYFAFEPDPDTFARLLRRHGKGKGVTLINAGVASRPGKFKLNRNVVSAVNSFHEIDHTAEWTKEVKSLRTIPAVDVDVVRLDDIAAEYKIERIDLLKSDTQGFEPEVLRGAAGLLREQRIGLMKLEVMPGRFYKQSVQLSDLEGILSPFGYELLTIGGVHYGRNAGLSYFDAFFAPAGRRDGETSAPFRAAPGRL